MQFTFPPAPTDEAVRALDETTRLDLHGSWDMLWGAVEAEAGVVVLLATVIGLCLVLGGVCGWAWQRRKNVGQGNNGVLFGAVVVGALFAAPAVLLPIVLIIIDAIVNVGLSVLHSTTEQETP